MRKMTPQLMACLGLALTSACHHGESRIKNRWVMNVTSLQSDPDLEVQVSRLSDDQRASFHALGQKLVGQIGLEFADDGRLTSWMGSERQTGTYSVVESSADSLAVIARFKGQEQELRVGWEGNELVVDMGGPARRLRFTPEGTN